MSIVAELYFKINDSYFSVRLDDENDSCIHIDYDMDCRESNGKRDWTFKDDVWTMIPKTKFDTVYEKVKGINPNNVEDGVNCSVVCDIINPISNYYVYDENDKKYTINKSLKNVRFMNKGFKGDSLFGEVFFFDYFMVAVNPVLRSDYYHCSLIFYSDLLDTHISNILTTTKYINLDFEVYLDNYAIKLPVAKYEVDPKQPRSCFKLKDGVDIYRINKYCFLFRDDEDSPFNKEESLMDLDINKYGCIYRVGFIEPKDKNELAKIIFVHGSIENYMEYIAEEVGWWGYDGQIFTEV